MATGLILDGVFGSEAVDSSGEVLDIEGADISTLEEGRGVLNYEHKNSDDKDSDNGEEIVGRILSAKKIFGEKDCDNARQRKFWNQIKIPFIYGVCRLYDGAGHSGAKALAAQIRDHVANNEPINVRFSVEGSTLEKEGNRLKVCMITKVAATIKPCNRTANSGVIEDPNAPAGWNKNPDDIPEEEKDLLAKIGQDAKKFEKPAHRKLGGSVDIEYTPFEEEDHTALIKTLVALKVRKALTAGSPDHERKDIPLDQLAVHRESLLNAAHNVSQGRGSKTPGPVALWQNPEGKYLMVDGHHRLVHHLLSGKHGGVVPAKIVGTGYSDLHPTPERRVADGAYFHDNGIDLDPKLKHGGLEGAMDKKIIASMKTHGRALTKTLTAGAGDVAPSQLTGGAALQREHIHRKVFKTTAMGVLKRHLNKAQYDRSALRAELKAELPSASDSFLDHFTGIADDYVLKLRKDEPKTPAKERFWRIHGGRLGASAEENAAQIRTQLLDPETWRSAGWGGDDGYQKHCEDCAGRGEIFTDDGKEGCSSCGGTGGVDDVRHGVSACESPTALAQYMKRHNGSLDGSHLVHFEGSRAPEQDHDHEDGAVLTHPSKVLGVWPVPKSMIDYVAGSANDARPYKLSKASKKPPAGVSHLKGPKGLSELSVQGEPVPLSDRHSKKSGAFFDEKEGALHTNSGVFLMNTIERPHPNQEKKWSKEEMKSTFAQALTDSRPAHQRAMKSWIPLNGRFSEGKTSPGLVSHAVLFAMMSPGNPVAMQEHMYAHAVDAMHAKGLDTVQTPNQWKSVGANWLGRNWSPGEPGNPPEHSRDYFQSLIDHTKPGAGVKGLYTKDGRVQSFGKPKQLHDYYMGYLADHHKNIMDAIRDTRGDGRQVARMLTEVNGIGPKLARYTVGMMGGGNLVVPDTHFLRHTFGLLPDVVGTRPGTSPDTATFGHIRAATTDSANAHDIMEGIDRHYAANHPSMKAVMSDPVLGKYFANRPEQALFPAFWWHWTSVAPHERMLGTPPAYAANSDVDHRPFFDATNQFRKSEAAYDPNLAVRTAAQHHLWVKEFGPEKSFQMYLEHLAPQHEANDALRPWVDRPAQPTMIAPLLRAEALMIDLRKTLAEGTQAHDPDLREVAPMIQHVYGHRVDPVTFKVNRYPAGRFMTAGNHINILEDYYGDIGRHLPPGPIEGREDMLHAFKNSPQHDVVGMDEILDGRRPELWDPNPKKPTRPASTFTYHRMDQEKPDLLEFRNGQAHLNGTPMKPEQVHALMSHAKNGHAQVRYIQGSGPAIQKMAMVIENLFKADDHPAEMAPRVNDALSQLDKLVAAGHLDPKHAEVLRQHSFMDPMTGHVMGNKFAYQDFLQRNGANGGIHAILDGNDFKSVNDKFGHAAGDNAIKSLGGSLRSAMDEASPGGKLFRVGGDEFAAHFPTHEHAAAFARAAQKHIDRMPPIQGTHRLSMSFGFGGSPEHADKALYEAKKQKYIPESMLGPDERTWMSKYQKGAAPHFAHSLVPGFEGALPLDDSQLKVTAPPIPAPKLETPPVIHTPPAGKAPPGAPSAPAPIGPHPA